MKVDIKMDDFKSAMTKCCDIGGLKCSCCNPTYNTPKKKNDKSILRKNARAKLKNADLKTTQHNLVNDDLVKIDDMDKSRFIINVLEGCEHVDNIKHYNDTYPLVGSTEPIHEYIGLSQEEYAMWKENPEKLKLHIKKLRNHIK